MNLDMGFTRNWRKPEIAMAQLLELPLNLIYSKVTNICWINTQIIGVLWGKIWLQLTALQWRLKYLE